MTNPSPMAEVWRGPFLESVHGGHAVVCNAAGEIVHEWGDPEAVILPRSSVKMIQALPLIESGAAKAAGLTPRQLALACASHEGAPLHAEAVEKWLAALDLKEADLRCGAHQPFGKKPREALIAAGTKPCQFHNNCSGKHAGFLTYTKHINAGSEYIEADHPLQIAIREAFEDVTGLTSPGYGIDGCSAPNFASTLYGIARAMAFFASAKEDGPAREAAAFQLASAMRAHPDMVAGEGRACTELMRAMDGKVAVKTGAEGVFIAILPEQGLGVALKAVDGATRAAECAIASILVKLGALDPMHPAAIKRIQPIEKNWRGIETGQLRPAAAFL
jgi:L-asparaginase II